MNSTEVSTVIGLDPHRVVAVAHMAWWVVQAAWLQAQQRTEAPARCRSAVDRLGAYARGQLKGRERALLEAHHSACRACSSRARELTDPRTGLLAAMSPVPPLGAEAAERWLALTQAGALSAPSTHAPGPPVMAKGADTVRIWLDPLASSAPAARRFASCTLRRWGATEVIELVQLLTSELLTNAAIHARSRVELVLNRRAAALRVEVHDGDATIPTRAGECRGLVLIDALADRWGATGRGRGKVVWFEIAGPAVEPTTAEGGAVSTRDNVPEGPRLPVGTG